MELVIITGMSGAGRSQAMKVLEDFGYYCVDNLPPVLIHQFVALCDQNTEDIRKLALVTDIRGGIFFEDLEKELQVLKDSGLNYKLLFLDSSDKVLIKRFKEARRSHPMNPTGSIEDGISDERVRLAKLRDISDTIIDTSGYNLSQFKNEMSKIFREDTERSNMSISIMSFGFKKGIPLDADFVFDARFLPNPFYVEELRVQTGNDKPVQDYVMSFQESHDFYSQIVSMVNTVLPLCEKEGRAQLIIAIGCTGGQHRSVTLSNRLYDELKDHKYTVGITHREIR